MTDASRDVWHQGYDRHGAALSVKVGYFASLEVVGHAAEQAHGDGRQRMTEKPDEIDPSVVDHVVAIRDRFGVRGLRHADALILEEIKLAEQALQGLPAD